MSEIRFTASQTQPLTGGYSTVRVSLVYVQAFTGGYSTVRISEMRTQPLTGGYSTIRLSLMVIQALFPVPEDLKVSTIPFPGFGNSTSNPAIPSGKDPFNTALPGLDITVHKKPMFKTRISEGASGNEVRNSLMQYPRWDFEMTYNFLEDKSGANSSLKTIMGFFLARQGSFDSWLFKDPDDYLVTNGFCGTADGVTTQFPFARTLGGFVEKVGQVDTANAISVFSTVAQSAVVPGTPYQVTVTNAATFIEDLGVTLSGTALTKVASAPATGQYSVAAGIYTFNSAQNGQTVIINYRWTVNPAAYTVTLPNLIIFTTAPAAGTITASFQFYFACRFVDDQMDFEKFYDKLWNLQSCNFRSIIQ